MVRTISVRRGVVGLFALLGAFAATAYADAAAGQASYAVCAACHGAEGEGNAAMNAPRLAGQQAWYLKRQLEAFQRGLRGTGNGDTFGMQMRPMALAVSEPAAVDDLIDYIGTLPDVPAEPTLAGDAAAGQAAYAVCAACHGPDGAGMESMGGPRLAGQDDWYLVRQIDNFQHGMRGYDPKDIFGNQMKPMASTLTGDKAINDVVAYLNTLR